jgi:hypothetical protein
MMDVQDVERSPAPAVTVQALEGTAAYHMAQVKYLLEALLGLDLDGWDDDLEASGSVVLVREND